MITTKRLETDNYNSTAIFIILIYVILYLLYLWSHQQPFKIINITFIYK